MWRASKPFCDPTSLSVTLLGLFKHMYVHTCFFHMSYMDPSSFSSRRLWPARQNTHTLHSLIWNHWGGNQSFPPSIITAWVNNKEVPVRTWSKIQSKLLSAPAQRLTWAGELRDTSTSWRRCPPLPSVSSTELSWQDAYGTYPGSPLTSQWGSSRT